MSGVQWGRGTGEGIGLSGHKNEYKSGVRIGNWVEEQFTQEASAIANQMKEFTMKQEAEQIAAASKNVEKNRRVEPNMGVPGAILFSHGRTFNEKFGASMAAALHRPKQPRVWGWIERPRAQVVLLRVKAHRCLCA